MTVHWIVELSHAIAYGLKISLWVLRFAVFYEKYAI